MRTTRSFALAALASTIALAVTAPVALGAEAVPQITLESLGGILPFYLSIRPWVAMAFIGMGLVAAISRLWAVLGQVGGTSLIGGGGGGMGSGSPSLGSVFTSMLLIVATVAGAILLLYTWVDIVNATVSILWSIMESPATTSAPAPPAVPPAS